VNFWGIYEMGFPEGFLIGFGLIRTALEERVLRDELAGYPDLFILLPV